MAFTCELCNGEFGSREQLETHAREEHELADEAGHICAACGSVFGSHEELELHAKADHAG